MNRPARRLSGTESQLVTKPSSSDSMPKNMMGPRTKPPTRLAGTETKRRRAEREHGDGRRGDAGGGRDADLLGQRPGQETQTPA